MDSQASQDLLVKIRAEQTKSANDPISAVRHVTSSNVRREALGDIGKIMMFGAGAGAAGRGAFGLLNLIRQNAQPKLRSGPAMMPLPLPFAAQPEPVPVEEEEQVKLASGGFLSGDYATQKNGIPWYRPAMLMGGLAAGYGGWKAVDGLLDQQRRHDVEDELGEARNEFQKVLLNSYDRPGVKQAADTEMEKLSADLDALYDKLQDLSEKTAAESTWGDLGGSLTGAYGMYAAPAALVAGYAAYNAGKKSTRRSIIEKAMKRRAQRNATMQPDELYATPVPVPSL